LIGRWLPAGRLPHVLVGLRMSDDLFCGTAKREVAPRVVTVVMRVDEEVDGPATRSLVQASQASRGLGRKLAVDDDNGGRVYEISDGPATHREETDIPADGGKDRLWCLSLPPTEKTRQADRAGEGGCGGRGKELTA
jgi:hypothetical protein